mmetsp:Transcript_70321/g.190128  ORF Transcript_70321/g.190128 Transcript_70321/m.190128 type:complete len:247 (-) Transcript_70321:980-1720(-)
MLGGSGRRRGLLLPPAEGTPAARPRRWGSDARGQGQRRESKPVEGWALRLLRRARDLLLGVLLPGDPVGRHGRPRRPRALLGGSRHLPRPQRRERVPWRGAAVGRAGGGVRGLPPGDAPEVRYEPERPYLCGGLPPLLLLLVLRDRAGGSPYRGGLQGGPPRGGGGTGQPPGRGRGPRGTHRARPRRRGRPAARAPRPGGSGAPRPGVSGGGVGAPLREARAPRQGVRRGLRGSPGGTERRAAAAG